MMMDLTSSMVDALLVCLGVVAGLAGGIQTIHSDTTTMSATSDQTNTITTQPSKASLPEAA